MLLGFVDGPPARAFNAMPADSRRKEVLGAFERMFGPTAARASDYIEQDWTREAWSRGGPVGNMGPGVWTSVGPALRAPIGRIHWAGTETATSWCGYMEGALQSADRAVQEVRGAVGVS